VWVDFADPPKLTEGPGMQEGFEGANVSISCRAVGNPQPVFNFYKVPLMFTL
jgi:hypothetical protein